MAPIFSDFLRRQRLEAASPYICGDVLDLGCGITGVLALLRPGQYYVGVEGHIEMLRWLKENHPGHEFYQRDLDKDELSLAGQFDTVLLLAVIEHLKNPDKILSQIPRYLKPDGRLLITTPSPMGDVIHKIGARMGLFYLEAVREHETIFTYDALRARLERNKLKIIHFQSFLLGGNQLFVCQSAGHLNG
jgi:SAM-dependent methyltransferase